VRPQLGPCLVPPATSSAQACRHDEVEGREDSSSSNNNTSNSNHNDQKDKIGDAKSHQLQLRDLQGLVQVCEELRLSKLSANSKKRPPPSELPADLSISNEPSTTASRDSLFNTLDVAVAKVKAKAKSQQQAQHSQSQTQPRDCSDDGDDHLEHAVRDGGEVVCIDCGRLYDAVEAVSSGLNPMTITNLRA